MKLTRKQKAITPQFKPMDQVKYTSDGGDKVGYGFVTSYNDKWVFVRYWWDKKGWDLRTTANSEPTKAENLELHKSRRPHFLWKVIERYHIKVDGVYDGQHWIYEDYPEDLYPDN